MVSNGGPMGRVYFGREARYTWHLCCTKEARTKIGTLNMVLRDSADNANLLRINPSERMVSV